MNRRLRYLEQTVCKRLRVLCNAHSSINILPDNIQLYFDILMSMHTSITKNVIVYLHLFLL